MKVPSHFSKSFLMQLTVLALGITTVQCHLAPAQEQPQRFWLAGRYDRNRIIVYFEAVKFKGSLPVTGKKLVPAAARFFDSVEISTNYVAQFQKAHTTQGFGPGDHYDLILEENHIAVVSLTTLVGCETDEEVGNDSFIGALATLNDDDLPYFRKDYYALREHQKGKENGPNSTAEMLTVWTRLDDEPVEFNVQTQIVGLLSDRMKTLATDVQRRHAESSSPVFQVQAFRLNDGTLRYYARAEWKPEKDLDRSSYALGAWISPAPRLHILALEQRTSGYEPFEGVLPNLLNIVDLGGKTGIIVSTGGDDSVELNLLEYRDGVNLSHMRTLQSIAPVNNCGPDPQSQAVVTSIAHKGTLARVSPANPISNSLAKSQYPYPRGRRC